MRERERIREKRRERVREIRRERGGGNRVQKLNIFISKKLQYSLNLFIGT